MVALLATGRASATRLDAAQVHDLHAHFVWATLQRLGVRPADLEDVMQEVFIVVHRRLPTFDASSRLSTWLFGICVRVASQYRRKAHRRYERPVVDVEHSAVLATEESPDAALATRQARERLEQVLDQLAPERRAVFVMFEIEGMTCADIAEQLGLPLGTVFSRLGAARTQFEKAAQRLRLRDERLSR